MCRRISQYRDIREYVANLGIAAPPITAREILLLCQKLHGGFTLENSDLPLPLLFKIHENQLAFEAAILQLSNYVDQLALPPMCAVESERRHNRNSCGKK